MITSQTDPRHAVAVQLTAATGRRGSSGAQLRASRAQLRASGAQLRASGAQLRASGEAMRLAASTLAAAILILAAISPVLAADETNNTSADVQSALQNAEAAAGFDRKASAQQTSTRQSPAFHPKPLPPEPAADHAANSIVRLRLFNRNDLPRIQNLDPYQLDADYSQALSLRDVLLYSELHNLPITISRQSWKYQRLQLAGSIISALPIPNFSMGLGLTRSKTLPNIIETNKTFQTAIRYPVFQGGGLVWSAVAQYYREKGWHMAYKTTVNDTLLDVFQRYENLLYQHALLHVRAQSVKASEAQLALANAQYQAGQGTQLAIMQARTQLATDRQALTDAQIAVRQGSLQLAFVLNLPMAINIIPSDNEVREACLIDDRTPLREYLDTALTHRPELRQYEDFRLTAARTVAASASAFYPSASFVQAYTNAKTVITPPNGNAGGVAVASISAASASLGTASNNALGQTASFSPTKSSTANSGANNTVSTPVVAASGGLPLNVIQSGSLVTSGAAAPSFINGGGGFTNVTGANTAGIGVFGSSNAFQQGFNLSWSLSNMGLSALATTGAINSLVPQAMMQANEQLLLVDEQIRADWSNLRMSRGRIDNAAYGVASAAENLRLAQLRTFSGMGTQLDVIRAQRDYSNALVTQIQAIVNANLAQAQLLHDTGLISLGTLTRNSL